MALSEKQAAFLNALPGVATPAPRSAAPALAVAAAPAPASAAAPVAAPAPAAAGGSAGPAAPVQASDPRAAALVNDPDFQALVEAMEDDGEAAHTQWQSQTKDGLFAYLEDSVHAEYDADDAASEKAREEFNLQWNLVVAGQGSVQALMAAYDVFSLQIGALQQANARIEAFITVKVAQGFALFVAFLRGLSQRVLARRLKLELERLKKALEDAEHEARNAKWKMALNIAVTAITTIVAPEATLAKVALAVGGMTAHIVIDNTLGSGTATGTVVVVGGESQEVIEHVSEPFHHAVEKFGQVGRKAFGIASGAIIGVMDAHEIGEAKDKVKELKELVEFVNKEFEDVMAGILPLDTEFIQQEAAMLALRAAIQKAMSDANDAARVYDALKQHLQDALKQHP